MDGYIDLFSGKPFKSDRTDNSLAGKKSLNQDEIEDVLRQAGWDEKLIPTMSAIGMGEGAVDPQDKSRRLIGSYNPGVGKGGKPTVEQSVGLFQINMHPSLTDRIAKYDRQRLATDPVYNAKVALEIYKQKHRSGNPLNHWGAYSDGNYKKFLRNGASAPQTQSMPDLFADTNGGKLPELFEGLNNPSPTVQGVQTIQPDFPTDEKTRLEQIILQSQNPRRISEAKMKLKQLEKNATVATPANKNDIPPNPVYNVKNDDSQEYFYRDETGKVIRVPNFSVDVSAKINTPQIRQPRQVQQQPKQVQQINQPIPQSVPMQNAEIPARTSQRPPLVEVPENQITQGSAGSVIVDLRNKPKGENTGRYQLRTALQQLAPKYGLTNAEIEQGLNDLYAEKGRYTEANDAVTDEQIQSAVQSNQNTQVQVTPHLELINRILNKRDGSQGLNPLIQEEVATNTAQGAVGQRDLKGIEEKYAKEDTRKQIENELTNPSVGWDSINQSAQKGLETALNTLNPAGLIENFSNAYNEFQPKEINSEIDKRLKDIEKEYGSFSEYRKVQDYANKMTAGEIAARGLGNYIRSTVNTAVSSSLKGLDTIDAYVEKVDPLAQILPESVRPNLRNAENLIGYTIASLMGKGDKFQRAKADTPVDKRLFYTIGDRIEKFFGEDKYLRKGFTKVATDNLGSMTGFLLLGLVAPELALETKLGQVSLTSAISGGLGQAGSMYDVAKNKGMDENSRLLAGFAGTLLGMTEGFGAGAALNKALSTTERKALISLVVDFVEEGGQETLQNVGSDAFFQFVENKDANLLNKIRGVVSNLPQNIAKNAIESGVPAGFFGSLFGKGVEMVTNRLAPENPEIENNIPQLNPDILTPEQLEEKIAQVNATRKTAPVTESPETLKIQQESAMNPDSPRIAVLYTEGENEPKQPPKGFIRVKVDEGILHLNQEQAKEFGLDTRQKVQDFVKENGVSSLLGKVNEVKDTSKGTVLVAIDRNTGLEVDSSIVLDEESLQDQIELNQQMYPNIEIDHQVMTVAEAIAVREQGKITSPLQSDVEQNQQVENVNVGEPETLVRQAEIKNEKKPIQQKSPSVEQTEMVSPAVAQGNNEQVVPKFDQKQFEEYRQENFPNNDASPEYIRDAMLDDTRQKVAERDELQQELVSSTRKAEREKLQKELDSVNSALEYRQQETEKAFGKPMADYVSGIINNIQPKPTVAGKPVSKNKPSGVQSNPAETPTPNISAEPKMQNRVVLEPKTTKPVKFSSTQVNLPKQEADTFSKFARSFVSKKDIADDKPDYAEDGFGGQPHITVKYGLHTNDVADIQDLFADEKPVKAKLGKTKVFYGKDNNKPYDVVIVEVDSPELHKLNKKIAENTDVTDTFPDYKPHLTVAYVKAGLGDKYANNSKFAGQTITFNSLEFSPKDGEKVEIPFGQPIREKLEQPSVTPTKSTGEGLIGQPKIVTVGDKKVELNPEQSTRWAEEVEKPLQKAKAEYDADIKRAEREEKSRGLTNSTIRQNAESRMKAVAFQIAAIKREITGQLTSAEQKEKAKREASNFIGKDVSVDGQNGKVVGNPFGKVKVQFADGTEKVVGKDKVSEPIKDTLKAESAPKTETTVEQRSRKIREAKEKGISFEEREGLTKPHIQTETNNEIEEVPVSQRVDIENLEDAEFTRAEVARKAKNEKIRSKTGFTKTQEEWFINELQKAYDNLEPDARMVNVGKFQVERAKMDLREAQSDFSRGKISQRELDEAEQKLELYLEAYPEDIKNAVVIDIPGDGTFKFSTAQGINKIHKKLTGKTIEEFRKVNAADYEFESLPKSYTKTGKEAEIRQEDETDITVAKVNEILGDAPDTTKVLTDLGVKQISNGFWRSADKSGYLFEIKPKPISFKHLEGFDLFAHKYDSYWRISDAVTGLMLASDSTLDGVIAKVTNIKLESFEKAIKEAIANGVSPRYEKLAEIRNTPSEIEELKPSEKANKVEKIDKSETDDGVMLMSVADIPSGITNLNKQIEDWRDAVTTFIKKGFWLKPRIVLTSTPYVLQKVGLKNNIITMTGKIFGKAMRDHELTRYEMEQIPYQLTNPVMVFESNTQKGSKVVVTDLFDKKNRPITIIVAPDGKIAHLTVNPIASVYGRNDVSDFKRWFDDGLLEYANKEKSQQWFESAGLQLPIEQINADKLNLLTEDDFVNSPLKKVRDVSDSDEQIRLATQVPAHELFDGFASIDKDGNLELDLKASENLRRHIGENLYQKFKTEQEVSIFDGLTLNRSQIENLIKVLQRTYSTALSPEMGYTKEELAGHKSLIDAMQELYDLSPVGVVYVFDDALPHELVHKLDLLSGRTDAIATAKLTASKLWKLAHRTKFNRQYGNENEADRISELVAILGAGEESKFGFDVLFDSAQEFESAKKEFLDTWADGVFRQEKELTDKIRKEINKTLANPNLKLDKDLADKFQNYANKEKTTQSETADSSFDKQNEGQNSQSKGNDKQSDSATETSEDRRYAGGISEEEPGPRIKLSQTPETMRNSGFDVADRSYIPTSNVARMTAANAILDDGIESAEKWLETAVKAKENNGGLTSAVAFALMNNYGKNGDITKLNKVADDIIPMITDAAQMVQSVSILNMYNPENSGSYATKIKKQKTGKDIAESELAKAKELAEKLQVTTNDLITSQLQNETLSKENEVLSNQVKDNEKALKLLDKKLLKTNLSFAEIKSLYNKVKKQLEKLEANKPPKQRAVAYSKLIKELNEKKSDVLSRLQSKYGDIALMSVSDIDTMLFAVSEVEYLEIPIGQDEIDIATILLADALKDGTTPTDFITELDSVFNGKIPPFQLQQIHATAVRRLQMSGQPLSAEQKAINQNKNLHKKIAEEFLNAEQIKADEIKNQFVKDYFDNLEEGAKIQIQYEKDFKINQSKTEAQKESAMFKKLGVPSSVTALLSKIFDLASAENADVVATAVHQLSASPKSIIERINAEYPNLSAKEKSVLAMKANELIKRAKNQIEIDSKSKKFKIAVNESNLKLFADEQKAINREKRKIDFEMRRFYDALGKSGWELAGDSITGLRRANLLSLPLIIFGKGVAKDIVSTGLFNVTDNVTNAMMIVGDAILSKVKGVDRTIVAPLNLNAFKTVFTADETMQNLDKKSGLVTAWSILKHGDDIDEAIKKDYIPTDTKALGARLFKDNTKRQKVAEGLGSVVDWYIDFVFRTRSMFDSVSKAYAFRKSLEQQVSVIAKNEGLSKDERMDLILNPSNVMQIEAMYYAEDMTFQNDNAVNDWWRNLQAKSAGGKFVSNQIIPFAKTVSNVLYRTLEHTPLGFAEAGRQAFKDKGNLKDKVNEKYREAVELDASKDAKFAQMNKVEQLEYIDNQLDKILTRQQKMVISRSIARGSLGSAGLALGYYLGVAGLIAGALGYDDDKDEYKKRRQSGIDNGSVNLGNVRFTIPETPFGTVMIIGATIADNEKQNNKSKTDVISPYIDAVAESFYEQSRTLPQVRGTLDFLDEQTYPSKAGTFFAPYLTPSWLSEWGNIADTKDRTGRTYYPTYDNQKSGFEKNRNRWAEFGKPFKQRLPVLRQDLPEVKNQVSEAERGGWIRKIIRANDPVNVRTEVKK